MKRKITSVWGIYFYQTESVICKNSKNNLDFLKNIIKKNIKGKSLMMKLKSQVWKKSCMSNHMNFWAAGLTQSIKQPIFQKKILRFKNKISQRKSLGKNIFISSGAPGRSVRVQILKEPSIFRNFRALV